MDSDVFSAARAGRNGAYKGRRDLVNVVIPDGLNIVKIGKYAFENCSRLTSVAITDSVVFIGDKAFKGCSSLVSVAIPDEVYYIGESAFEDCGSLTSVKIPDKIISIGKKAFDGCGRLTDIYFRGRHCSDLSEFESFAQSCGVSYNCDCETLFDIGISEFVKGEIDSGFAAWRKALKYNDPAVYYNLGLNYVILDIDVSEGIKLLHRGADALDDNLCQYALGSIYFMGLNGEEPDIMKAYEYWAKAADHKNPYALFKLGYSENMPELDIVKNAELLGGLRESATYTMLGLIYLDGCTETVGISEEIFREFYDNTVEIERNLNKAVCFLKKGVDKGNTTAKFFLGRLYYNGEEDVIEADRKKGLKLLSEAAAEGCGAAVYFLTEIEDDGEDD
ncbi:leucine-rich repeat protein [bacterium]|nr:leucine-rich repeat protein [bacterium]